MAVVDLKSVYRTVNVYAPHAQFQGFSWGKGDSKKYFVNHRLSFGLRCAPSIFSRISDFIVKVMAGYGVDRCINYLDDFIIVAKTAEECLLHRNIAIEVMEFLGFQVAYNKVTDPNKITTFLKARDTESARLYTIYLSVDVDPSTPGRALPV